MQEGGKNPHVKDKASKTTVPWVVGDEKLHCNLPYHELGLYELILFLLTWSHGLQAKGETAFQEWWGVSTHHFPSLYLKKNTAEGNTTTDQ